MRKRVFFFFLTILLLLSGTTLVILYGRGYRFNFQKDKTIVSGTGLLVATSTPDGAQIFINDKLVSATNNTLNLLPGDYEVKIIKTGYLPWTKKLKIQKEIVAKTDALLFPVAPKFESLTSMGISTPILDPTKMRITYKITALTPEKNGIYLLDMSGRPILTLQSGATKIADDTQIPFSKAELSFSPNAKFIIATISAQLSRSTYLLSTDNQNQNPQEIDKIQLDQLKTEWQREKDEKEISRLNTFKPMLSKFISSSFKILSWSPDETKILYEASQSAVLPLFINPPLVGANTQAEERQIQQGKIYVYDTKEDKNFPVKDLFSSLTWLDSQHLILTHDGKIEIMEYDETNKTTIYAGLFLENFVAPWPNGSKLVILTNLTNPAAPPNLYTISLK